MSDKINIEVSFALPHKQTLLALSVDAESTLESCIQQSGILAEYPEIDLKQNKVGIWSRTKKLTETVREGDRIEIYRPLIADPKEVRRRRAEKAKEEGRADKVTGGRPNKLRAEP
ncbi:RnfH family protein [Algibacillus agarilyticus]|uniref:RnfH family protein n=1 Tax=Algibacillus agarilyticus TaxID=2234133 RepID=UPI000DD0E68F|nr:RnfH family protein [Algibacillus agarilyticus]